ncbi:hypothetical protein DPMN_157397 [Dreissena polymorpha]|uniref:Uncharacterized protein n=1 Tax=Dreissena polymorpha TaxID=45954 RepID=A0A9D4EI00_DREPO|nr:hypothetical protein DPMN_157397 [Dreissena polymorpha]
MILIGQAPAATCYTAADVKALKAELFDGYDVAVRPTDNQNEPSGSAFFLTTSFIIIFEHCRWCDPLTTRMSQVVVLFS